MSNQPHTTSYGAFWVANSIVSSLLGANNRRIQEEASTRNQNFQRELDDIRAEIQDEIEAEKTAFKRRMMKISRQYRLEESAETFSTQLQAIELQSFIDKYWPLSKAMPNIILSEIEQSRYSNQELPLNIILLHTPLLPTRRAHLATKVNAKDAETYKEIERQLYTNISSLRDVRFRRDSCTDINFNGGNANMMNIHFLMSSLPTLVISPQYSEGKMTFNAAAWDAQASRPLIRNLFSFSYEPLIAEQDEKYFHQAIEKMKTALTVIVGAIRDSYMLLTHGKAPMLKRILNDKQFEIIKSEPKISEFIRIEYENIVNALNKYDEPHLLDAYSEYDIKQMRQLARKMSVSF